MEQLKFGISLDMVNLHHQEPNRNRFESKYYWDELYPLIAAAGFNSIELPYDLYWMFRGGSGVPLNKYCIEVKFQDASKYLRHLKINGIDKVAGLHFSPTLFMRNNSLDFYLGASGHFGKEAIRHAAALECEYVSFTPAPPYGLVRHYHRSDFESPGWMQDFLKRTTELFNSWVSFAKEFKISLTIRDEYWNLFRGPHYLEFIRGLDSYFKMDLDPAHAYISGKNPIEDVIANSKRIGAVHLSDTSFSDTQEIWKTPNPEYPETSPTQVFRDLGCGSVDLKNYIQTLVSEGYDGWIICSSRQTRDPMRAILRTRAHLNTLTNS